MTQDRSPNPARPPADTLLCALTDIADPGAKGFSFRVDDQLFAGFVVRQGGMVRGYVDQCPHVGLPLAVAPDRYLTRENDLILCGAHGALFRLETGACVAGPCWGKSLEPWPVVVENGEVRVARP
jgi:nitrite reductase/ring-hydroxylating ferredoxin subunit